MNSRYLSFISRFGKTNLKILKIGVALIIFFDFFAVVNSTSSSFPGGFLQLNMASNIKYSGPSLFLLSNSYYVNTAIYLIGIISAIIYMFDRFPKINWALLLMILISHQNRFSLMTSAADNLLVLSILYTGLLTYFVAEPDDANNDDPDSFSSVLNFIIIFQIAVMYFISGFLKTGTAWTNGNALYYVLSDSDLATTIASKMSSFPALLKGLTFSVKYFETYAWLLWFLPKRASSIRILAVLGYILMNIGFLLFLNLGFFPILNILLLQLLLPPWTLIFKSNELRLTVGNYK